MIQNSESKNDQKAFDKSRTDSTSGREMVRQRLHALGDRLEHLGDRIEHHGYQKIGDLLENLGDQIEHLMDKSSDQGVQVQKIAGQQKNPTSDRASATEKNDKEWGNRWDAPSSDQSQAL